MSHLQYLHISTTKCHLTCHRSLEKSFAWCQLGQNRLRISLGIALIVSYYNPLLFFIWKATNNNVSFAKNFTLLFIDIYMILSGSIKIPRWETNFNFFILPLQIILPTWKRKKYFLICGGEKKYIYIYTRVQEVKK